jgi:hypothetical protein
MNDVIRELKKIHHDVKTGRFDNWEGHLDREENKLWCHYSNPQNDFRTSMVLLKQICKIDKLKKLIGTNYTE